MVDTHLHRRILFIIFILLFFPCTSLYASGGGSSQIATGTFNGDTIQYYKNQLGIKFYNAINNDTVNAILTVINGTEIERFSEINWVVIQIPDSDDALNALQLIQNFTSINLAVPLCLRQAMTNDPYWSKQWYLHRITSDTTKPPGINVLDAWSLTKGSSNVVMTILDSGLPLPIGSEHKPYLSHEDLQSSNNRIKQGHNYVFGQENFLLYESDTTVILGNTHIHDIFGHGTEVTGIAGASTDNNAGIASVAPACNIFAIKIAGEDDLRHLTTDGRKIHQGIYDAVDEAKNNPSKRYVINLSYGGATPDPFDHDAIRYAYINNVTVVVSAGNYSIFNPDQRIKYPAAYSKEYSNVIAVGAVTKDGTLSSFSCMGSELNVCAPGGEYGDSTKKMITTYPPNNYSYNIGTSFSAPLVTGTIGLMLSVEPNLTPSQIRNILQTTAVDIAPAGFDTITGYGRIDAGKAVAKAFATQLLSPSNNANVQNPPRLTWQKVTYASSYRLQTSTSSSFATIATDSSGITDTTKVIMSLSDSTYYWRVRSSIGDTIWSAWSDPMSFHVILHVSPQLVNPSNAAVISNPPRITWMHTSGAVSYRLQISTSSNFSSPVVDTSGMTDTTKIIYGLSGTTAYYWRVRYITADPVWSAWSNTRIMRITPPPAPTLTAEMYYDGSDYNPKPTWSAINDWGSVQYKLYRRHGASGSYSLLYTGTNLSYIDTWEQLGEGDVYAHYYAVSLSTTDNILSNHSDTLDYQTYLESSRQSLHIDKTKPDLPTEISLKENFPNPFNPTTTIYYTLPEDRYVKIIIINTLGREVATLVDGYVSAGYKSVTFDASSLPSGVYFYMMQAVPSSGDAERHGAQGAHSGQAFSNMKKMLLVK